MVDRLLHNGSWQSFYRDSGLDRIRAILNQHFDSTCDARTGTDPRTELNKLSEKKHTAANGTRPVTVGGVFRSK